MTSSELPYLVLPTPGVPVKAWVKGVPFEAEARRQLVNVASLPVVFRWVAAMPDVHAGIGATVGAVIPTIGAILPAAVGVDIGCGVMAVKTSLEGGDLPSDLRPLRDALERAVPHGRTGHGGRGDRGAWSDPPAPVLAAWQRLSPGYREVVEAEPDLDRGAPPAAQLGTLGTGNHFLELCLDEGDGVWLMLHSGSRGAGNRIGTDFIARAREEMGARLGTLPDRDLAWLEEGTPAFESYVRAVGWAQSYARVNRELMMEAALAALGRGKVPPFTSGTVVVNCHHNYVARERHFGREAWVTRKGAVRAGKGELALIPGSMGARSYVVRGLGNPDSFESASHGAGRAMSRGEARRRFTVGDLERATAGVECRKDEGVLDEIPGAYKDVEAVLAAQRDLVETVHVLRQVLCVKG